jgi:hypothetical protein
MEIIIFYCEIYVITASLIASNKTFAACFSFTMINFKFRGGNFKVRHSRRGSRTHND